MVDGVLYTYPFSSTLTRTFLINDSTCDMDRVDFTLTDHNGDEVTSTSTPFWYDGEILYFQSSDEEDMGTFYWSSIGITFYIASDPAGVAAYLASVEEDEAAAAAEAELMAALNPK
jgi:hypothetical protein